MGNITETQPTVIFNPRAPSGFAPFAEITKKHANYCTDVGFFSTKLYWYYQFNLFIHPNGCQMQRDVCFYYSPTLESGWQLRGERSHIRLLIP